MLPSIGFVYQIHTNISIQTPCLYPTFWCQNCLLSSHNHNNTLLKFLLENTRVLRGSITECLVSNLTN